MRNRKRKMPIVSVRSSTLKFAAVLIAGVLAVTAMVIFLPPLPGDTEAFGNETVDYANVETAEDAARFLEQFGLKAEKTFFSDKTVTLPAQYEGVFAEYAGLQRKQGFDLSAFAGKKLRKITLEMSSGQGLDGWLATLFIYRKTVVGGDISSGGPTGEALTFREAARRVSAG